MRRRDFYREGKVSLPYYLVVQMLPMFGELSRADVEYAIQRTNKVCTVPEITKRELLKAFEQ